MKGSIALASLLLTKDERSFIVDALFNAALHFDQLAEGMALPSAIDAFNEKAEQARRYARDFDIK